MKGETMKKEEIFEINGDPQPSIAYLQWRNYFNNFIIPGNVIATLKQNRDFFYGIQYDFRYATNTPKPCLNPCKEGAERIAAKITGTGESMPPCTAPVSTLIIRPPISFTSAARACI